MRYSSICGAKICYPSASGTPRTLSGRWCGNVRALLEDHGVHLPKKTPVTTAGRASKKTPYIRVASPHFLRNNSYIILHPWINEICAQQIGSNRDFHAFPNPSKSKYGSFPIYHHLLRCFSHEKTTPITREISYISNFLHQSSHLLAIQTSISAKNLPVAPGHLIR